LYAYDAIVTTLSKDSFCLM